MQNSVRVMLLLLVGILLAAFALTSARAQESTPRYVIYYNSNASPPEALIGTPYTHVILSFITVAPGAPDAGPVSLVVPSKIEPALALIARLQAEGKRVLISFGGGAMQLDGYTGLVGREDSLADAITSFVSRHGFDGIDIDFEVSAALESPRQPGVLDGRRFLIDLTAALRQRLPAGALISHAPQAPYLDPAWHGGPYLDVLRAVGGAIDWIMVQYYNNPDYEAPVARRIVGQPPRPFVTSYTGILGSSWPSEKTLVGLPVYRDDASSGHLAPEKVISKVVCPLRERYGESFGGLTGWQFSTLTADHRFWNHQMAGAVIGSGCLR
jgi:chitinase